MNFIRTVAVTLCVIPALVDADPLPLKDLEKVEQYQRAIDASNKLEALVDETSRKRTLACTRAFGHTAMCKCLSDNLPYAFSFSEYVAITTQTKEQNGYAKLDKQIKVAYDNVGAVRDRCVRENLK
jgi:hypothetical protein